MWFFPDIAAVGEPNANVKGILKSSGGVIAIKAGYGSLKDTRFDRWRDQARDAKLLLIYHFVVGNGRSHGGSPEENAHWFTQWIGKRRPNEVYVIDVESASGNWNAAAVNKWRDNVQHKLGGPRPIIYANESFVIEHGLKSLFHADSGWVARYGNPGSDGHKPKVPHLIWQHAADGYGKPRVRWPGCPRTADENWVDVPRGDFIHKLLGTPAPKPAKPNPPSAPLTRGSHGGKVEMLQHCLNYVMHFGLVVDGSYGPATETAVLRFQRYAVGKKWMTLTSRQEGRYYTRTYRALKRALGE